MDPCVKEPINRRAFVARMYREDQTLHMPVSAVKMASSAAIVTKRGRHRFRVHRCPFPNVIYIDIQPPKCLFMFIEHRIQKRAI